ncbi:acyl-CoA dehydrogenase family protein [Elizabethkingia sp. HX XZB]|uniref:acyl-CoA dehydrogenase family protein n=1 Tax=Elizabethkingia TaxID=308865 RepID=UPI000B362E95|nr:MULTISPECIES: acyl-CoA dehydrogenase family protein [Elizabethkingia]MDX8569397.1 acyl-CoA dehydrogenase family protein [Elizabethkingia sp. HX XZB]NHQ70938.1 acyl-CoA dehydrogenase [Elizabethkingia miricola]NHQ77874.1 acyl-CoA dehydrogenase [Elizabethkingia miricola]PSL88727.1 acyl-CoA dehydrogenase [Elizabethkingia miricola]QHQ86104.1 acyl-CoA dehydrogenase [Elizabethkingia miricola]
MQFNLNENQCAFQEAARSFAQKELAPYASEWDAKKIFPREAILKAGELGFCGIYTSEESGGLGLSRLDAAIIFEELAAACPSTTAYITIHNMVSWMIDEYGKDEIRQELCHKLSTGDLLGSYCLTEPGSGSDAASLKTTAVKQGNKYLINGTKAFISGAGESDVLIVMARTGDASSKGISAFVVSAKSPGISFGENEKKLGWNTQPTRFVFLDQVEVDESHLLGTLGEGFKIALKGLDGGRINIGTCSVGAAQGAINQAQRYMHERQQFGKSLAQFQSLQFKIADMVTELVAARQMIHLAAFKLDSSDPNAATYCAMAKRLATDMCFNICNEALQILGGYGCTQDFPVERLMRDARVHQVVEGTNEIMKLVISRKILEEGATLRIR